MSAQSALLEVESSPEEQEQGFRGEAGSTLTGSFRMHRALRSKFLELPHDVLVYLPPGYDEGSHKHYPVLYAQDGQNLFDALTAFGGQEWHVDETAQEMIIRNEVEPLIIVGIYNTGAHRIDEYTPTHDNREDMGGEGELYGRFMVEELKPLIDMTYRTRQEREATGVLGSSLGGLISLYLGLRYPQVFGRIGVMSPSIWWDRRMILRLVRALKQKTGQRIWLDCGVNEGKTTLTNVRDLKELLLQKGWVEGEDLGYVEAHDSGHDERAWAARFGAVLGFLFPKEK